MEQPCCIQVISSLLDAQISSGDARNKQLFFQSVYRRRAFLSRARLFRSKTPRLQSNWVLLSNDRWTTNEIRIAGCGKIIYPNKSKLAGIPCPFRALVKLKFRGKSLKCMTLARDEKLNEMRSLRRQRLVRPLICQTRWHRVPEIHRYRW